MLFWMFGFPAITLAIYYAVKWTYRVLTAFLVSAPMVILLIGFLALGAVGMTWNHLRAANGHELLPLDMSERTIPFIEVGNISAINTYDPEFEFSITNNSVYPVSRLSVECDYATEAQQGLSDTMYAVTGSYTLLPGETRVFRDGSINSASLLVNPLRSASCRVTSASTPFRFWKGITAPYEHLDWQRGYRGRNFTR